MSNVRVYLCLLGSLFVGACGELPDTGKELARHDFPYPSHYLKVLDSRMHYIDTGGTGSPIIFVHGTPTWSYLWRNVIPVLEKSHRVIAVDLIGFGKSGQPDIVYTLEDHQRYFQAFIAGLGLDKFTLAIHDWGLFIGLDFASQYPERIEGIITLFGEPVDDEAKAVLEALSYPELIVGDRAYLDRMKEVYTLIEKAGDPSLGHALVVEDHVFIERILPITMRFPLSENEHDAYREPWENGRSRKPLLEFPREVRRLMAGTSPYMVEAYDRQNRYLVETTVPKLIFFGTYPGRELEAPIKIAGIRRHLNNVTVAYVGPAGHFLQEEHPVYIGKTIASWMDGLKKE